jgi:hypothetical protein
MGRQSHPPPVLTKGLHLIVAESADSGNPLQNPNPPIQTAHRSCACCFYVRERARGQPAQEAIVDDSIRYEAFPGLIHMQLHAPFA